MNEVNISKDLPKIEMMLRDHGVFPTSQRMAIAQTLFSKHQHVTADQVQAMLKEKGFLVSKATVYNTLNTFVQSGLLNAVFMDSGQAYFDSNNSSHHHLYNIDTGELTDITDNLEANFDHSQLPAGTALEGIDIVIRVHNTRS
jgi:Fur family transcriptional regulator, iron response regulator